MAIKTILNEFTRCLSQLYIEINALAILERFQHVLSALYVEQYDFFYIL